MSHNNDMIIYTAKDGQINIDVTLQHETVWLSQKQMATLFNKNVPTINEHIKNIYAEAELNEEATIRKSRIVQTEGNRKIARDIYIYNLDVIISVGYRVKSKEGTQFRIWATQVLKQHLLQGYSLHEKRLAQQGVSELEQSIAILHKTLVNQDLVTDIGESAAKIIWQYAKSWKLLLAYDENQLPTPKSQRAATQALDYHNTLNVIQALKTDLIDKGEASPLFGNEREHGLESILHNIEQTFGGESLYPSLEAKAAHLLYFVIKDHPFTDGNKRIGSLLFLLYLKLQNLPTLINESGIVALALLVAESDPAHKELIIKLVVNLISIAP